MSMIWTGFTDSDAKFLRSIKIDPEEGMTHEADIQRVRGDKPGMYQTPKDATTHLLAIFGISGVLLALLICGVNYVSKVVTR